MGSVCVSKEGVNEILESGPFGTVWKFLSLDETHTTGQELERLLNLSLLSLVSVFRVRV